MFVGKSLEDYIAVAASGNEIPGGGSVSAVIGALGCSMGEMVGNFTTGKKKFAEVEDEVRQILAEFVEIRKELLLCVDSDAEAFLKFNDVYAMPKNTDDEKQARSKAMQECLFGAMVAPLVVMRFSLKALKRLPRLAEIGNQNLITDVGVAGVGLYGALKAARYNVLINLKWMKDKDEVEARKSEVDEIIREAKVLAEKVEFAVEAAI